MILNAEQCEVQRIAREFAQREIAPFAQTWDAAGHSPPAIMRALGELGFMGMCVDPAWNGAGMDYLSYVVAIEEIAVADCGICNMMCVNNSPNCAALAEYGSEFQKETFLRPLAQGVQRSAFALTEPTAGSDAAAIITRAKRDGDHYVLNGVKQFVTAGRSAEIALVVAVTDPSAGKRGLACFLTSTVAPGYLVMREESKLGQRTADTCQIALENLRVPITQRLGDEGQGYRIALAYLEIGRIGVAAQAVGVARAAFDAALKYATERDAFGRKLIEHQAINFKLAEMATAIEAARQLTWHAAALKDANASCLKEASMAKLAATEMAERVCSQALQIHGGYGYVTDFPIEKYYRDARVLSIYEGTNEIQRMVIGRELVRGMGV